MLKIKGTHLAVCACLLGGATGIPLIPAVAHAQGQAHDINLPAQPLASALAALSKQTGIQIFAAGDLVAGRQAPAVSGHLTARDALNRLLSGSGLEAAAGTSGDFVVQRATQSSERQLPEVKVQASGDQPGTPPKPYAGGQVARGGSVGILGNRDMMDTPFNQSNYTAELIQNQQVRHVADVLPNDPTAHANGSVSTGADDFSIRGFYVNNTELLFNGMPGIAPSFFNSMMVESIERVEVLKGPNALLNGVATDGGVGGTINLVPKRAGNEPLTQFNATWSSDAQLGGHLDAGRRFGENKEVGIRFNGVYRDGDTAIDYQSRESRLMSLAIDYRGDRGRAFLDIGHQEQNLKGVTDYTSVAGGVPVPPAPDNNRNYDGPNDFSHPKVWYGTLRGELDLTPQWTAFAALGNSERKTRYNYNLRFMVNAQGDLAGGPGNTAASDKMTAEAQEYGIRGRFETGAVGHQLVLAYNQLDREWRRQRAAYAFPASNIYNPVHGAPFPEALLPDPDNVPLFQQYKSHSTVLADTLSFLDERVLLTLGVRDQYLHSNFVTFASNFEDSKVTPSLGVVVKPWQRVSLYANYIEGLQEGAIAPIGTANEGQGFAPFTTKQHEIGGKVDFGRVATTLALYQIAQPSAYTDTTTNIFGVFGEQRHRGVDFNVFGEVSRGVRILGGAAYIDSELTKTQDGINQGNRGPGVPELRLVLGGEWDTPFLERLTLTGRAVRNGSMYLDAGNTQVVPAWTRLDIGARYRINKTVTLRANIDNVLDKSYWDANAFGQLTVNDPRIFSLTASFNF
jgi:iron complex outermembrane receptor protein